jgi:sugar O-acyltransferase (sialic acid O-acetyltransferase NeuD family)
MTPPKAILIGAGGHAGVLLAMLAARSYPVEGLVTPERALHGTQRGGFPILGDDEAVLRYAPQSVVLVNAVGSVGNLQARRRAYERLKARGYGFLTLVHPTAVVEPGARLGEGVQVCARALVQAGASVGDDGLLNSGSIVEHDCRVGAHVHVATGAILCGGVEVADDVHVGAGAVVIQGIRIGAGATVAAGAVVIRGVAPGVTVAGVPAKEVSRNG